MLQLFVQNILLLSSLTFIFYLSRIILRKFRNSFELAIRALIFSSAVILVSTYLIDDGGIGFSANLIIILAAFLYGGPLTGFITLATSAAGVFFQDVTIRDPYIYQLLGSALTGYILHLYLIKVKQKRYLSHQILLLSGLILAAIEILADFLLLPPHIFLKQFMDGYMAYPITIFLFWYMGNLMNFAEKRILNEENLIESEKKIQSLLESVNDSILLIDGNRIIECNPATSELFKKPEDEIIGKTLSDFSPEFQTGGIRSEDRMRKFLNTARSGQSRLFTWLFRDPDGTEMECEISMTSFFHEKRRLIVAMIRDQSQKKETENVFKIYSRIFGHAREAIMITDVSGDIVYVNKAFTRITGYEAKDVFGRNPRILKSEYHDAQYYKKMWSMLGSNKEWEGEIWNRRKDGEVFPAHLIISVVEDAYGQVRNFVGLFNDLSDIKRTQEEVQFHQNFDALTQLPNREAFLASLGEILIPENLESHLGCLVAVDIQNFKYINDHYGYMFGDQVLKAFSETLTGMFRDMRIRLFSRIGKDEFVVFLGDLDSYDQATYLIQDILTESSKVMDVGGQELFLEVNIGLAFTDEKTSANQLLKNADLALNRAKTNGSQRFEIFKEDMNLQILSRMNMETEFRSALENDEFIVVYQPKVNLKTSMVTGMEALVRWRKKDGNLVSPMEFIPFAEETGMIIPLGQLVLEKACRFTKDLIRTDHQDLRVSVNISVQQMKREDFMDTLKDVLLKTQLYVSNLDLEITESSFIDNPQDSAKILRQIHDLGIQISLDDFGTGYSSLSYLQKLPFDTLKIDKSFIDGITEDQTALNLTDTIIRMAHSLGYTLVAEGVETEEQAALLRDLGCDTAQGALFSMPIEDKDFIEYFKTHNLHRKDTDKQDKE